MARPLRILVPGGWYSVTSRGNRRQDLFLDDDDRRRFLGLVSELPERFGIEVHAHVLMDNHYHLLVRTPQPNLSHAIRWLNVSYSSRFNWAHQLSGHVFQGRFHARVIEGVQGVVEVARYLHLNPVRIAGLGLGKAEVRQARVVGSADPGVELVARRLRQLDEYVWSSWRVYSGAEPPSTWLETSVLSRACGGRTRSERATALRAYTEAPVREGHMDSPWDRLVGGLVLGTEEYAQGLLKQARAVPEEQTPARTLARHQVKWEALIGIAEELRGRTWKEMCESYGEWGRDGVMHVAIRYGGWRLAEVVQVMGAMRYQAAAQAMRRFRGGLEGNAERERFVRDLRQRMSTI